jgi:hypothetical protein
MSLFKPVVTSSGVLLALSDIAEEIAPGSKFSDHVVTPAFRAGAFIGLIGVFVLALALIQLHSRQTERIGHGALVAALFAGFGTMLLACVTWSTAFLDPAAAKVAPTLIDNTPPVILVVGFFMSLAWFGLSWAAYAIVMLRSGVLAIAPVVVMLLGALASVLPMVPFAVAIFGLGACLARPGAGPGTGASAPAGDLIRLARGPLPPGVAT